MDQDGHFRIDWVPSCPTTMDRAREGALDGAPSFSVYGTDWQTAGRGRFTDRTWITNPGDALTFTILLRPPFPRFPLSLLLGLGLASWLKSLDVLPQIKWPNDVLVGGKKISGILVESTPRYALAGIGVNIAAAPPSDHLRTQAVCLQEVAPRQSCLPKDHLLPLLARLRSACLNPVQLEEMNSMLFLRGKKVRYTNGQEQEPREGILLGVGENGELCLESKGRKERLVSAEILGHS